MALADLTTLEAVKAYASITNTATDQMLGEMIAAFSAFFRGQANRDITLSSYDIRRSGRGTFALQLPQYPIQSIDLLEIDGRTIAAQAAWGTPGFYFDEEQIALESHMFTRGVSNIHIQFTAGLSTVPADVAAAVNEIVTLRYRLRDKLEWSSKSLASETVSLVQKAMPDWVKSTISDYQRVAAL